MTKASASVLIRPLAAADRSAWQGLWTGYLTFYDTVLPAAHFDLQFSRLLNDDPQDFHGLVAERDDGTLVGLTHYVFHRHGWRPDNVCYLQDLYTDPAARGLGVARALIAAVYDAADAAGAPSVYWMTNAANTTARALYDRVATLTPFIKYQRTT